MESKVTKNLMKVTFKRYCSQVFMIRILLDGRKLVQNELSASCDCNRRGVDHYTFIAGCLRKILQTSSNNSQSDRALRAHRTVII